MTAEMATTYPADGGPTVWGKQAYGPFFGYALGCFKLIGGIADNALYPALFVTYLDRLLAIFQVFLNRGTKIALRICFSTLLMVFNTRGLEVVGLGAVVVGVLTLGPFVILCIWGGFHTDPRVWVAEDLPWNKVDWTTFINIMLWNLNAWEGVASFAGQVKNPSTTFPKALGIAVVLVVCNYALPIMVSVGMNPIISEWSDGFYGTVAVRLGGKPFAVVMLLGAAAASSALYMSALAANSYQLAGMAQVGLVPQVFGRLHKSLLTPVLNILLIWAVIVSLTAFSFNSILNVDNIFYVLGLLMQIATLLRLRFKDRTTVRPFRIPLPNWALALFLCLPAGCCIFVLVVSAKWSLVISAAFIVATGVSYLFWGLLRRKGWARFDTPSYSQL